SEDLMEYHVKHLEGMVATLTASQKEISNDHKELITHLTDRMDRINQQKPAIIPRTGTQDYKNNIPPRRLVAL
ncbi:hypothetical protein PanWU01x14_240830, partial [Parasponia andersonii]